MGNCFFQLKSGVSDTLCDPEIIRKKNPKTIKLFKTLFDNVIEKRIKNYFSKSQQAIKIIEDLKINKARMPN